ncbi:MAG: oligosaccharide flippase family protein [Chloroflexi bacterium]|nr:oligosaccharide flippase family protein [Chloroflexota bacterium]
MTSYYKTVIVIAIGQLINYGLPLLTFPLLIRAFDIDTYGYWIEANTLAQFAIVFGATGLGNALGALIVSKPDQESKLYSNILFLYICLCTVLTIGMLVSAPILNTFTLRASHGTALIRIVAMAIPIGSFNWLATQLFRLRKRATTGAVFDILIALGRLLAVVFAFFSHDILRFAWLYVISQGIITMLQVWVAYKRIPLSQLSQNTIKELIRASANISTISQANWLVMFGDRLMLAILSTSSAVAIYSASYQISLILVALSWPFLYILLPSIGERWKLQDELGIQQLIRKNIRIMFILLTPSVIGLGLIGDSLLRLLATKEFAQGGLLVGMIAAGVAIDNIGTNLQYLFFVQDRSHLLRPIYLSAAALNLIINLAAIPLFSYYGAGVTTFMTFAYILFRLQKATQMPLATLFDRKTLGRCLILCFPMGIWVWLTNSPSIIALLVSIGGGAIIYGLGIFLLGVLKIQDVKQLGKHS